MGAPINARMGLNTWAAFVGTDSDAAIAGDVAMLASEVTPVLKALRQNGLQVVAIHHHMTGTQPTIFFLHYRRRSSGRSCSDRATIRTGGAEFLTGRLDSARA